MTYTHKSIIKRSVGVALWIGGFLVLQLFVRQVMDNLIFCVNNFTVPQKSQITTFLRITILIVYLFVLAVHTMFSDNSVDKIFSWMGPSEKQMLKSIIEDEEKDEEETPTK